MLQYKSILYIISIIFFLGAKASFSQIKSYIYGGVKPFGSVSKFDLGIGIKNKQFYSELSATSNLNFSTNNSLTIFDTIRYEGVESLKYPTSKGIDKQYQYGFLFKAGIIIKTSPSIFIQFGLNCQYQKTLRQMHDFNYFYSFNQSPSGYLKTYLRVVNFFDSAVSTNTLGLGFSLNLNKNITHRIGLRVGFEPTIYLNHTKININTKTMIGQNVLDDPLVEIQPYHVQFSGKSIDFDIIPFPRFSLIWFLGKNSN